MKNIVNSLLSNGVLFLLPDTCFIEEGVQIKEGVFIGPNVQIFGKSKIEQGVVIEGSAFIKNSIIRKKAVIRFSCKIEDSIVGESSQIGPFAHLRPESIIGDEVKIGNFVETKKVTFEKNSKASHLSYIGDASIGENTNIGAGTITCNYDGKNKFKTTIEKNVFIGSNSALVAPVTIEEGATVGAGSTIRKDVKKNSLALTVGELRVKEDWKK